MSRHLFSILFILLLSACSSDPTPPTAPLSNSPELVNRGRDLVKGLAACGVCHGEAPNAASLLAGGRTLQDQFGSVAAANLTSARTGLAEWKDDEIIRAFRASLDRHENWLSGQVHKGYEWMSDEDAYAVVAYLRTLPPVEKEISRRSLSFIDRNTKGFFDSRREVRGFIPAIDKKSTAEYGQYLTDHVARCGGCHNSPESLMRGEKYLEGGRTISSDLGEKVAPAINGSRVYGLGEWTEAQIVAYLKTGIGPDGSVSDSKFCPTGFYRNASDEDLTAIARYLRTVPG